MKSQWSRRNFLKAMTGAALMAAAGALPSQVFASGTEATNIQVPRSLMLHSRHQKQMPELMDFLCEQGYTGITYEDLYQAAVNGQKLPQNPFLLTIDDLSMSVGVPSFKIFEKMKTTLDEYQFKATFAIITRPDLPQDDDLWAEVTAWGAAGYGLENHTSYHSNLDNPKWIEDDYHAEIGDAAWEIRNRTGQPARTVITPFGSGYDHDEKRLNPLIAAACRRARIPFVVGIVGGREAITLPLFDRRASYLGRCTMGIDDTNASGIWEVEHWGQG